MSKRDAAPPAPKRAAMTAIARCLCGAVEIETAVPARWAWHDHSLRTRRAHGAAYATYVGAYKSRTRIVRGEAAIARYEHAEKDFVRSFCKRCGTPLFYERSHSPTMVNIPRALFDEGIGREPRYHIAIEQVPEWAYAQERLAPLKGYPGIVWNRARKKRQPGIS